MGALLLASCASQRGSLAGPRPVEVAVAVLAGVATPPAQNVFDDVGGVESPASLAGREAVRSARGRGYRASLVERVPGTTAVPAEDERGCAGCDLAALIARSAGADATLLVRIDSMDLESVRSLGRASIDLEVLLVAGDGTLLWSGAHSGATRVTAYRARNDWRAHLRDALDAALTELP